MRNNGELLSSDSIPQDAFSSQPQVRTTLIINVTLLLLGLDNSGKTTIVKRLAGEPIDSVVPTVGFSLIFLRQKGCQVSVYDLGGGPQIRDIWPRYYADAHGVIFVTDAHDGEKMEECRQVLEKVIRHDQISGKPILLLANKQDLDGALDEIDIVDRLNLEEVVNEHKCPTLVELCSALNFSKKMDVGIENGYKWLVRSIVRDYPALNGRVARDLAKQEEENKIKVIRKLQAEPEADEGVFRHANGNPFKPVKKILEEKNQANGFANQRKRSGVKTNSVIPGLVQDPVEKLGERKARRAEAFSPPHVNSHSLDFFVLEKFQSDLKLLNDVPNHTLKNFLVRPKSSGARLYGVKSERKRTHRRKPLMKGNKTRPSPFTDISNGQVQRTAGPWSGGGRRAETGRTALENVNPFLANGRESYEMRTIDESKSVPNSRRNSDGFAKKRRLSLVNAAPDGPSVGAGLTPAREILLDVTKIGQ